MGHNSKKLVLIPYDSSKWISLFSIPFLVFITYLFVVQAKQTSFKENALTVIFILLMFLLWIIITAQLRLRVTIDDNGVQTEDRLTKRTFRLEWSQTAVAYHFHRKGTFLLISTKPLDSKEIRHIYRHTAYRLRLTPVLEVDGVCCFPIDHRVERIRPWIKCEFKQARYESSFPENFMMFKFRQTAVVGQDKKSVCTAISRLVDEGAFVGYETEQRSDDKYLFTPVFKKRCLTYKPLIKMRVEERNGQAKLVFSFRMVKPVRLAVGITELSLILLLLVTMLLLALNHTLGLEKRLILPCAALLIPCFSRIGFYFVCNYMKKQLLQKITGE